MIIDIPQQNPITQTNKGDLKGSIKETFNVDLSSKPDKIGLSFKTKVNITSDDLASLGLIHDFVFFNGYYYALSAGTDSGTYSNVGKLFRGSDAVDDTFDLPTWTVNTTDFNSDATAISFNDIFYYISGDMWKLGISGSDTSFDAVSTLQGDGFAVVFNDRAYYTNGSTISSFGTDEVISTSGSYTLRIPANELAITGMDISSNQIWIATSNEEGGKASVFAWDGVSENAYDAEYKIPETSVLSMRVHNNIPYVTTGSGRVLAFNGSYFEEVAVFPFTNLPLAGKATPDITIQTTVQGKWIHNRGMEVIGNKLHFLVSPVVEDDDTTYGDYNKLAGIWCLDPEIGLYHRFAISTLTINGEQAQLKHVGALREAAVEVNTNTGEFGSCLFGFSYYTENSTATEKYAIGYLEPQAHSEHVDTGYITTNRIYAQNIADTWEKICVGFEEMNSTDSIIVKYRTIEKDAFNVGITWVNSTSYTSTDSNLATVKTNFDAGIGYESRILYGDGSGVISKITNITESSGTYTITVDTAHNQTPTNTAVARLENWQQVETITDADNNIQFKQIPIVKDSNWIQYKFILNGTETQRCKQNPVINRIVSVSNQHTKFQ